MWQLLFAEKQWPLVDHWCQFLQVAYWLFLRSVSYFFFSFLKGKGVGQTQIIFIFHLPLLRPEPGWSAATSFMLLPTRPCPRGRISYIFVFGRIMFFRVFPLMYVFYSVAIQQAKHNKAISRDTWSQLLEFARVRWIFKVIAIILLTII